MSAAILAGSIVAGGSPSDASFRGAFLLGAAVALIAAVTAAFIPKPTGEHAQRLSDAEQVGAAGPVGEPVYAGHKG